MGALTKHVSVAATHSKVFSLPQSSAALKNKTKQNKTNNKKRSCTECKCAKGNSGGRNTLIFQVPSGPADLNTVLVQVYNLGEEANTEQEKKKKFIHSGIIARHSNNSAQLIYRGKIKTTTC